MGLLRDETTWDGRHQPSGVVVSALLAATVVCAAGCVAIALGDGGRVTWLGVAGFLVGLFCFLGINLRGVGRRRRRRARAARRPETSEGPGPTGTA
jgi:ABC-type transport system involved in cytochrome c biogenesis permease subunit